MVTLYLNINQNFCFNSFQIHCQQTKIYFGLIASFLMAGVFGQVDNTDPLTGALFFTFHKKTTIYFLFTNSPSLLII
jgi:hypothetical protein